MSRDYTPEEVLNWLCWMWALKGERFYSAKKSSNFPEKSETDGVKLNEARAKFRDMKRWGLDPVEGAAREHRDVMDGENDVSPIDWSWWYDE